MHIPNPLLATMITLRRHFIFKNATCPNGRFWVGDVKRPFLPKRARFCVDPISAFFRLGQERGRMDCSVPSPGALGGFRRVQGSLLSRVIYCQVFYLNFSCCKVLCRSVFFYFRSSVNSHLHNVDINTQRVRITKQESNEMRGGQKKESQRFGSPKWQKN